MCGACGRNYIGSGSVYKKKKTTTSTKGKMQKNTTHSTNNKQNALIQHAIQHVKNNPDSTKSTKIKAILKLLNAK